MPFKLKDIRNWAGLADDYVGCSGEEEALEFWLFCLGRLIADLELDGMTLERAIEIGQDKCARKYTLSPVKHADLQAEDDTAARLLRKLLEQIENDRQEAALAGTDS